MKWTFDHFTRNIENMRQLRLDFESRMALGTQTGSDNPVANPESKCPRASLKMLDAIAALEHMRFVTAIEDGLIFPKKSEQPGAWEILQQMCLERFPADFKYDQAFVRTEFKKDWTVKLLSRPESGDFILLDPDGNKRVAVSYQRHSGKHARFTILPRYRVRVEKIKSLEIKPPKYEYPPELNRVVVLDYAQKGAIYAGEYLTVPKEREVTDLPRAQERFEQDRAVQLSLANQWLSDNFGKSAPYFDNTCWAAAARYPVLCPISQLLDWAD